MSAAVQGPTGAAGPAVATRCRHLAGVAAGHSCRGRRPRRTGTARLPRRAVLARGADLGTVGRASRLPYGGNESARRSRGSAGPAVVGTSQALGARDGGDQFAGLFGSVEGEAVLAALLGDADGNRVLAVEGAAEAVLRQQVLDGSTQRPGAVLGAVALGDQQVLRLFGQNQLQALLLEALHHLGQLDVDDGLDVLLAQPAEDDDVVHSIQELRTETVLHRI